MSLGAWCLTWVVAVQAPQVVSLYPGDSSRMEDVDAALRTALAGETGLRVQAAMDTMMSVDAAREAGWTCSGGTDCLATLGRSAAADVLLEYSQPQGRLRIRAVDVKARALRGVAEAALPAEPAARTQLAGRLARQALVRGGVLELLCDRCGLTQVQVGAETVQLDAQGRAAVAGLPLGATRVASGQAAGRAVERTVTLSGPQPVKLLVMPTALLLPGESAPPPGTGAPKAVAVAPGSSQGASSQKASAPAENRAPPDASPSAAPQEDAPAAGPAVPGLALVAAGGMVALLGALVAGLAAGVVTGGVVSVADVTSTDQGLVGRGTESAQQLQLRSVGGAVLVAVGVLGGLVGLATVTGGMALGVLGGVLGAR